MYILFIYLQSNGKKNVEKKGKKMVMPLYTIKCLF